MPLLKKPEKPKWRPLVAVRFGSVMKEQWKPFLDVTTWAVEVTGHVMK
jgi:hypothetical protein